MYVHSTQPFYLSAPSRAYLDLSLCFQADWASCQKRKKKAENVRRDEDSKLYQEK